MQPAPTIVLRPELWHEEAVGRHINKLTLSRLLNLVHVQPLHAIDFGADSFEDGSITRPTRSVPGLWHGLSGVFAPVDTGSASCLHFAHVPGYGMTWRGGSGECAGGRVSAGTEV